MLYSRISILFNKSYIEELLFWDYKKDCKRYAWDIKIYLFDLSVWFDLIKLCKWIFRELAWVWN